MKNIAIIVLAAAVVVLFMLNGKQKHEEASPVFKSLEQGFEYQELKMRQKTSTQAEYMLLLAPKHDKESTRPYYNKAVQAKKQCDSLMAFVDRLKNGLAEDVVKHKDPHEAVRQLMMRDGMAKELSRRLGEFLDSVADGIIEEAQLRDSIRSQYPVAFGDSANWDAVHFSGSYDMAQMELSRIKAQAAEAEWLVVSQIIEDAGKGCVLYFDQHWGMAVSRRSCVFPGDRFEAVAFFAQRPDTTDYKVIGMELGGRKLAPVNGVGTYTAIATGTGMHNINGKVIVKNQMGLVRDYPVRVSYKVGQRFAAITVDSGQILYAGVATPITVKVAGDDAKDIVVTSTGGNLKGINGKYVLTANETGKLTVRVAHKSMAGKLQPIDSAVFLVKKQ